MCDYLADANDITPADPDARIRQAFADAIDEAGRLSLNRLAMDKAEIEKAAHAERLIREDAVQILERLAGRLGVDLGEI